MFTRANAVARLLINKRVQSSFVRNFGAHVHYEPHVLGSREGDYVRRRTNNQLYSPPGVKPRYSINSLIIVSSACMVFLSYYLLNVFSTSVKVEVKKVAIKNPDGEIVHYYKPMGLNDAPPQYYGYELVKAPIKQYTIKEKLVNLKIMQFNQEMDLYAHALESCPPMPYILHGRITQEEYEKSYVEKLSKQFLFFNPAATVADASDPSKYINQEWLDNQKVLQSKHYLFRD